MAPALKVLPKYRSYKKYEGKRQSFKIKLPFKAALRVFGQCKQIIVLHNICTVPTVLTGGKLYVLQGLLHIQTPFLLTQNHSMRVIQKSSSSFKASTGFPFLPTVIFLFSTKQQTDNVSSWQVNKVAMLNDPTGFLKLAKNKTET